MYKFKEIVSTLDKINYTETSRKASPHIKINAKVIRIWLVKNELKISDIVKNVVITLLERALDWHEYAVLTHIVALVLNPQSLTLSYIINQYAHIKDLALAMKKAKSIDNRIRKSERIPILRNINKDDFAAYTGLVDLFNKHEYGYDWEKDVDNRLTDEPACKLYPDLNKGCYTKEAFRANMPRWCEESLSHMYTARLKIESFSDFIDRAPFWLSPGSAINMKYKMHDDDGSLKRIRLNKRLAVDVGAFVLSKDILGYPNYCLVNACSKFENGKERNILNADMYDYILGSYVLHHLEYSYPAADWTSLGKSNVEITQMYLDISEALKVFESFLAFDYADFNKQHGLQDQCDLYDAMLRIWHRMKESGAITGDLSDMEKCIYKLKMNHYNQYMSAPITDGFYFRMMSGLVSGKRNTAAGNTHLNKVYNTALLEVMTMYTLKDIKHFFRCEGDDLISLYLSWLYSALHFLVSQAMHYEAQPIKVDCSRKKTEFLRKMFYKDGRIACYLNRAVATLLVSSWANADWKEPYTRVKSVIDGFSKSYSRRANSELLDSLQEITLNHWKYIYNSNVQISDLRITSHPYMNGFGYTIYENKRPITSINTLPSIQKVNYTDYVYNSLKMEHKLSSNLLNYFHNTSHHFAINRRAMDRVERIIDCEPWLESLPPQKLSKLKRLYDLKAIDNETKIDNSFFLNVDDKVKNTLDNNPGLFESANYIANNVIAKILSDQTSRTRVKYGESAYSKLSQFCGSLNTKRPDLMKGVFDLYSDSLSLTKRIEELSVIFGRPISISHLDLYPTKMIELIILGEVVLNMPPTRKTSTEITTYIRNRIFLELESNIILKYRWNSSPIHVCNMIYIVEIILYTNEFLQKTLCKFSM